MELVPHRQSLLQRLAGPHHSFHIFPNAHLVIINRYKDVASCGICLWRVWLWVWGAQLTCPTLLHAQHSALTCS